MPIHILTTVAGSIKCGFEEKGAYEALYPFPPMENDTDLSRDEWSELGSFFMEKGNMAADRFRRAAWYFAHATDKNKVFFCVRKLIENNHVRFVDHIDECEEFRMFKDDVVWNRLPVSAANREG